MLEYRAVEPLASGSTRIYINHYLVVFHLMTSSCVEGGSKFRASPNITAFFPSLSAQTRSERSSRNFVLQFCDKEQKCGECEHQTKIEIEKIVANYIPYCCAISPGISFVTVVDTGGEKTAEEKAGT